jgi:hypothetical protein
VSRSFILARGQFSHIIAGSVDCAYRPGMKKPGRGKSFDTSPFAIAQRWKAGRRTSRHAQTLRSDHLIKP